LKGRDKACFWTGAKLDNKSAVIKSGGFAHSILWICSGLSTALDGWTAGSIVSAAFARDDVVSTPSVYVVVEARSAASPESGFFSARARRFKKGRQVYKQKACIQNSGNS